MNVPFNKPYLPTGTLPHILRSALSGTISGNGVYTKRCQRFFEERYRIRKCLLTTSCTDALEMAAILSDVGPGDEVILPSFTFMSTANAFLLRGASLVFTDTSAGLPNIDPQAIEKSITPRTRVIVVVHYSGIACDMDRIMELAKRHSLLVVEDAAHAIDARYRGKPLGSIGHFGTFSFHETKNIVCGEGGMLAINDPSFLTRAEIIWEKGTNRAAFYRGEVNKYNWVDIGSSFLPSDATAAFLFAQLKQMNRIQERRIKTWNNYFNRLKPLEEKGYICLPALPEYASVNGNLFWFTVTDSQTRNDLLQYLKQQGVSAVFHYLPLHDSPYFREKYHGLPLPNTLHFSETIVRLPFYYKLTETQLRYVCGKVVRFFTR